MAPLILTSLTLAILMGARDIYLKLTTHLWFVTVQSLGHIIAIDHFN